MTLILYNENNLWGIRNSADKILLPAIYSDVSVYIFKKGVLIKKFEINKHRLVKKTGTLEREIKVEPESIITFLVKKNSEFFLFKLAYNQFNHQFGIVNLINQFNTLESFELSPTKRGNLLEEINIIEIGKFYKDIIHIGNGLFKIKFINVYMTLEIINEDGDQGWQYNFENFFWKIVDNNGNSISEKAFTEVDVYFNNFCKIRVNESWNFLDETGATVLHEWHYHLEYPILNEELFLAGKKSYFISISLKGGPILFRTTDFHSVEDLTYNASSSEMQSILKKINKSNFTTKEIETLIRRIFGEEEISVDFEERKVLDLYNKEGFLQRLGVGSLKPLMENLFVAVIDSDFFYDIDEMGNQKIFRHCGSSYVFRGEGYGFSFQQQRLVNSTGTLPCIWSKCSNK